MEGIPGVCWPVAAPVPVNVIDVVPYQNFCVSLNSIVVPLPEEIEKLVPYAVSWQIKEKVGYGTREENDLRRIKSIIDKVGYRGVLPFEALGQGDPRERVAAFLQQIRTAFSL